jgi:hypothetical protein
MYKILLVILFVLPSVSICGQKAMTSPFQCIRYPQDSMGRRLVVEFWDSTSNKKIAHLDLKQLNPFSKFNEKQIGVWDFYDTPIYELKEAKKQIDSINLVSKLFHLNTPDLRPFQLLSSYTVSVEENRSVAILYELSTLNHDKSNISTSSIIFTFDAKGAKMTQSPLWEISCGAPAVSSDGRFMFFMAAGPYGWDSGGAYMEDQLWVYDNQLQKVIYKSTSELYDMYKSIIGNYFFTNTSNHNTQNAHYKIYDFYNMITYNIDLPFAQSAQLSVFEKDKLVFYDPETKQTYYKYYNKDFLIEKIQR